jgi:hypothetical protein
VSVERSLFSLRLSRTINNLQVADACASPSNYVQVRATVGCIVGCGISGIKGRAPKYPPRATAKLIPLAWTMEIASGNDGARYLCPRLSTALGITSSIAYGLCSRFPQD